MGEILLYTHEPLVAEKDRRSHSRDIVCISHLRRLFWTARFGLQQESLIGWFIKSHCLMQALMLSEVLSLVVE